MFSFSYISRPLRYVPLLTSKRWRVRILPKENYEDHEAPGTRFLKPGVKTYIVDFYSFVHRKNLTWAHYRNWKKWKAVEAMRKDQKYMPERHKALGPDLATTHFLAARGGKIKFVGNDKWMSMEDIDQQKIPSVFVHGFFVEEIDASGLNLCYEGFDNLSRLAKLKKLILSNCPNIDDWCLGRNHLFANTLEYLDISGCHLVTERGICTLHSLKKLKTLVINDTPNIQNKELVSLLLQDIIPECEVIGVNYCDPTFLKRIESFMH